MTMVLLGLAPPFFEGGRLRNVQNERNLEHSLIHAVTPVAWETIIRVLQRDYLFTNMLGVV